ncbi:MAG TPA: DUF47 domain-containing protein [Opitutaceae bacterium]|nr:DUF47 domain-containing protein [Opitutaceae bacterium]
MFSLKKLLGRDDKFFELLEAASQEARSSVELLGRYLRAVAEGQSLQLDEFVQARRKEKRLRHQMTEALGRTFVTPLDREDIESLSFALYRIPKQIEKLVERLSIFPGRPPVAALERQADLLRQAADAVVVMVGQLRHGAAMERIAEANDKLQFAEGEADKVMLALLQDLYRRAADAKELVLVQDLHEMIEQAVDRCRNAGNVVVQIALKNS